MIVRLNKNKIRKKSLASLKKNLFVQTVSTLARLHSSAGSVGSVCSLESAGDSGLFLAVRLLVSSIFSEFTSAGLDDLNLTITAVILSHPVPSPQVSGAKQ